MAENRRRKKQEIMKEVLSAAFGDSLVVGLEEGETVTRVWRLIYRKNDDLWHLYGPYGVNKEYRPNSHAMSFPQGFSFSGSDMTLDELKDKLLIASEKFNEELEKAKLNKKRKPKGKTETKMEMDDSENSFVSNVSPETSDSGAELSKGRDVMFSSVVDPSLNEQMHPSSPDNASPLTLPDFSLVSPKKEIEVEDFQWDLEDICKKELWQIDAMKMEMDDLADVEKCLNITPDTKKVPNIFDRFNGNISVTFNITENQYCQSRDDNETNSDSYIQIISSGEESDEEGGLETVQSKEVDIINTILLDEKTVSPKS